MKAYWYEDGYIRTSGYEYNVHDFEPEIHLTNDAVQKKFRNYSRYENSNKLSYEEFQRYLNTTHNGKYNFRERIIPEMKEMALDSVKSIYLSMAPDRQMHNFEIFGMDFMIDHKFKPWLIEVNTNPDLSCACPLLDLSLIHI